MNLKKLVLIVTVAAVAVSAMAQGGGGGGRGGQRGMRGGNPYSPMSLLRRADVQKDLGISDDQKSKIEAIRTAATAKTADAVAAAGDDRQAQGAARTKVNDDAGKDALAVLTADQQARLKGIVIQIAGPRAATVKEVQVDLGLSDDQKKSIADLVTRQGVANRDLFAKQQDGSMTAADVAAERKKNDGVLGDEIGKVLTDAQKAKLKDMAGKPFAADPQPQGRGGGGGGRRGGGN
jgi:hypothetical protein